MAFRLHLPRRLYEEMLAQAAAELPNECCGLLAGRVADGVGVVEARYPLVNAAASPREYLSDGRSMFAAVRDIDRRGLDILAVYHSHPTSAPVPSRTDLERNSYPDAMCLIVSLQGAAPEVRAWRLTETDYREAEWECVG
ncbi:MAG TPA: M67 family metallopeptidase [Gemmataceae bacterium]|nr:M67 family metallopeptidase [Gemmataceae bacterium]